MADVTIELGGATRALRFRMPAWYALEQAGYDMADLGKFHEGPKKFTNIATVVWAMCQEHTPAPSLKEVLGWIDLTNLAAVMEALGKVLREDLPEGSGTGNPPAAERSGAISAG